MRSILSSLVFGLVFSLGCSSDLADEADDSSGLADAGPLRGSDARPVSETCHVPLLASDAARPLDLLTPGELDQVQSAMACVLDIQLFELLEHPNTILYNKKSIIPGYQDSFGDNVVAPIGMRPNTIRANLIDLAVPGGHAQIFESKGNFHFPFGNPIGVTKNSVEVVNFWHIPSAGGELLPVAWWKRDPNDLTHRVEWIFPAGTVFGELMFIVSEDGQWHPFEIRTRERLIDSWIVDAYRPFPQATNLADELEARNTGDSDVAALIAHLRDETTLQPDTISATNFQSAFPPLDGAKDLLPPVADDTLIKRLLAEVGFRSARDAVWKQNGALTAYAASAENGASISIVPPNYNGGAFAINEDGCGASCHIDAGRPLSHWYENILAYGELWGGDQTFTWHPFRTSRFVNAAGEVQEFNYDNREIRPDFLSAGAVERYSSEAHPDTIYRQLPSEWVNFSY
jgi:hypothetical protein